MGGEATELVVVEEQVDAGDPAVVLLAAEDERHATVDLDDERGSPVDGRLSNGGHLAPTGEVDGETSHAICTDDGMACGMVIGAAVAHEHDVGIEQVEGLVEVAGTDSRQEPAQEVGSRRCGGAGRSSRRRRRALVAIWRQAASLLAVVEAMSA